MIRYMQIVMYIDTEQYNNYVKLHDLPHLHKCQCHFFFLKKDFTTVFIIIFFFLTYTLPPIITLKFHPAILQIERVVYNNITYVARL